MSRHDKVQTFVGFKGAFLEGPTSCWARTKEWHVTMNSTENSPWKDWAFKIAAGALVIALFGVGDYGQRQEMNIVRNGIPVASGAQKYPQEIKGKVYYISRDDQMKYEFSRDGFLIGCTLLLLIIYFAKRKRPVRP